MRNIIEKMDSKWAWQSRLALIAVAVLFLMMGESGQEHHAQPGGVAQVATTR
jgi:hypothetical protein